MYNYAVQKLVEEKRDALAYKARGLKDQIRVCENEADRHRIELEEINRQLAALDEPTAPKTVEITD